jgi:murein DD-endopeptidase MepM/ murein hydrolase activator NlpD
LFAADAKFNGKSPVVTQGYNDSTSHFNFLYYSVDIAMDLGSIVRAQGNGEVIEVRDNVPDRVPNGQITGPADGFGNFVTIRHDFGNNIELFATYMHLKQFEFPYIHISVGDRVNDGQFIGRVGFSGDTHSSHEAQGTFIPHLHVTYGAHERESPTAGTVADGRLSTNPEGGPVYFTSPKAVDGHLVEGSLPSDRGTAIPVETIQEPVIVGDGGLLTISGTTASENHVSLHAEGSDVVASHSDGSLLAKATAFAEAKFKGGLFNDILKLFHLGGTGIANETVFFDGDAGQDTPLRRIKLLSPLAVPDAIFSQAVLRTTY